MDEVMTYFKAFLDDIKQHLKNPTMKNIFDQLFEMHWEYDKQGNVTSQKMGFDLNSCSNIDTWIKLNYSGRVELDPTHRDLFNVLFNLYHANSNLLLLAKIMKSHPEVTSDFSIATISKKAEMYDIVEKSNNTALNKHNLTVDNIYNDTQSNVLVSCRKLNKIVPKLDVATLINSWNGFVYTMKKKDSELDKIKLYKIAHENKENQAPVSKIEPDRLKYD